MFKTDYICSLKNSETFMQVLPLHTSWNISIHIVLNHLYCFGTEEKTHNFFADLVDFFFSYNSCCLFLNGIISFSSKSIIFTVCFLKDLQIFFICIHHALFLYHEMSISQTLNTSREYVDLLFLWMIFHDCFYIFLFFLMKDLRSA